MRVRQLGIRNFRGIKKLDWSIPDKRLICLIGPGDSGKSTILDALGLLLSDKWNVVISSHDFNDVEDEIVIEALVTGLPEDALRFDGMGLVVMGLAPTGKCVEAPVCEAASCMLLRFSVDDSFEPKWEAVNKISGYTANVPSSFRRRLGVHKVDERIDAHLRWNKKSALGKFITKRSNETAFMVKQIDEATRNALWQIEWPSSIRAALDEAKGEAESFGAPPFERFALGLDATSPSSKDPLALYSGSVPLAAFGKGTRKISSLAMQRLGSPGKTTYLIDEVETGLEPHRVVSLLQLFEHNADIEQVFMSSHSPIVVEYCECDNLAVVYPGEIETKVTVVPRDLASLHRTNPSAFLSRRVLVVEGKTEEGLLKTLLRNADEYRRGKRLPISRSYGLAVCQGGGDSYACDKALKLRLLGFEVALLLDNDNPDIDERVAAAQAAGVTLFRCEEGQNTEAALIGGLNRDRCISLIQFVASEIVEEEKVLDHLHLAGLSDEISEVTALENAGIAVEEFREILLKACTYKKKKGSKTEDQGWFKGIAEGELLGDWMWSERLFDESDACGLAQLIKKVLRYVYRGVEEKLDNGSGPESEQGDVRAASGNG